jgi:hypothetical protein
LIEKVMGHLYGRQWRVPETNKKNRIVDIGIVNPAGAAHAAGLSARQLSGSSPVQLGMGLRLAEL